MGFHLLLVEDDAELREIVTDYFIAKGEGSFTIDTAATGEEGLEKSADRGYDLVLLDVMLPEIDGFTICRELRRHSPVPVIFLTARHKENDRLHGYRLGCDDYVAKPFSLAELYAKVTALIRRSKGLVREGALQVGPIRLDPFRYTVHVGEHEVTLPPIEFALLRLLMENKGRAISRDSLLTQIWGYDFAGNDRVVDNHVKKLRQALGSTAAAHIKTVFKLGYKMEV